MGYHAAVARFKRQLLELTLEMHDGNRTRTAKALGLERTYLLRLIKVYKVRVPPGRIG